MFELLTQVLLWLLIFVIVRYILQQFITTAFYTRLGFLVFAALIVLSFFYPNESVISEAWSILSLPLRPLGLAVFLLGTLVSWGDAFKPDKLGETAQNRVLWVMVILVVSSAPVTAYWLSGQLETEVVEQMTLTRDQDAPVLVVLAQGTTRPGLPPRTQIELTESGDRLRYAAQLVRNRPGIGRVIICGGKRSDLEGGEERDRKEVKEARAMLEGFGVPAGLILVNDDSESIRESAQGVRELLTNADLGLTGTRSIYLVTSALEMRRAMAAFTHFLDDVNGGITVLPRATDFSTIQEKATPSHNTSYPKDLLPSEEALAVTGKIVQEQLVAVYYFLRGWLAN